MSSILLLSSDPDLLSTLQGFIAGAHGFVIGALGFIVAFGLAVFIHELGHFLAAKAFRVPVERFVIGMDKQAMGFLPNCIWERKWGETTYGISLVPLGGYVKMAGTVHPDIERYLDGDQPTKESEKKDNAASLQEQAYGDMAALYKKPFWQKVIIYGAGVSMNMVLAMLVMTFIFTKGFEDNAPLPAKVAWIAEDSPYANTALKTGDSVIAVNGVSVANADELLFAASVLSDPFMISLQRLSVASDLMPLPVGGPFNGSLTLLLKKPDGEQYTYSIPIDSEWKWTADFGSTFIANPAYIDFVNFNTPASKGGLQHGDFVKSIDGVPIVDWGHMRHIIRNSPEKTLHFVVKRKNKELKLEVTPWEDSDAKGIGQIGVIPGNPEKIREREKFREALTQAPKRVYIQTINYISNLKRLGSRVTEGNVTAVRRELGGPVGIAQVAYKMAQKGFDDWLRFLIGLNVALAVMNMIPFPVLDGGHIVFAIYEAIFRRPVPPQVLVPVMNGAVLFFIAFFVLVTFNDVMKLFS